MSTFTVHPKPLSGTIQVPPSKSHSQRALLFALKGQGFSQIENLLDSPDVWAMRTAIEQLGATCEEVPNGIQVRGGFSPARGIIDAKNSGQIFRFIPAIASVLPSHTEVTGDRSIQTLRPIDPLLRALRQLGATATRETTVRIEGPISPGTCRLDGSDSQPVSALLMALSFLEGPSEIIVDSPGETPWIDLTLMWLKNRGASISHCDYRHYWIKGSLSYQGFHHVVSGDYSSAAFPLIAALVTGSSLQLTGLSPDDIQGDRMILDIVREMGAKVYFQHNVLCVEPSELRGIDIDVNQCIDALPILATLGCYANGQTRLYNGAIARSKESDRIQAIAQELRKLGGQITEEKDGLIITQSTLTGSTVFSHRDHRIALSLAVAAMGAKGPTTIEGTEWIDKSYPNFAKEMNAVGAHIELDLMRV